MKFVSDADKLEGWRPIAQPCSLARAERNLLKQYGRGPTRKPSFPMISWLSGAAPVPLVLRAESFREGLVPPWKRRPQPCHMARSALQRQAPFERGAVSWNGFQNCPDMVRSISNTLTLRRVAQQHFLRCAPILCHERSELTGTRSEGRVDIGQKGPPIQARKS